MKITWDEPSYKWFRDSSEYTGYDSKLAEIILSKINPQKNCPENVNKYGTLCDMGCGAGEIDLRLAPYFDRITCVDINSDVIDRLKSTIIREGFSNITAVSDDGMNINEHFDTVMAIYHARNIDRVKKYLELADRQLILVVRASRKTEIGVGKYRLLDCYESTTMQRALDENGIGYEFTACSLEHGQPFRTYEDAIAYVMLYCEMEDQEQAKEYLTVKLKETGEEEFSYYLPKKKEMGIFVINKE